MNVDASTRVTTRYLNGFVPLTSIASICSVTFIEPSSAPILLPIFPAKMSAVMTGPISDDRNTYDRGQLRFHPIINHRWPQLHGQYQAHDECR